jgi:hypothetical protein
VEGVRDQLLARAGLAAHQHGDLLGGDLPDDPEGLLHARILRPHPVEQHRLVIPVADREQVDDPASPVADRDRAHANLVLRRAVRSRDHGAKRLAAGERLGERALRTVAAQQHRRRCALRDVEPEDRAGRRRRGEDPQLLVEDEGGTGQVLDHLLVGGVGAFRHDPVIPPRVSPGVSGCFAGARPAPISPHLQLAPRLHQ